MGREKKQWEKGENSWKEREEWRKKKREWEKKRGWSERMGEKGAGRRKEKKKSFFTFLRFFPHLPLSFFLSFPSLCALLFFEFRIFLWKNSDFFFFASSLFLSLKSHVVPTNVRLGIWVFCELFFCIWFVLWRLGFESLSLWGLVQTLNPDFRPKAKNPD